MKKNLKKKLKFSINPRKIHTRKRLSKTQKSKEKCQKLNTELNTGKWTLSEHEE
jgi:hypothetical protein